VAHARHARSSLHPGAGGHQPANHLDRATVSNALHHRNDRERRLKEKPEATAAPQLATAEAASACSVTACPQPAASALHRQADTAGKQRRRAACKERAAGLSSLLDNSAVCRPPESIRKGPALHNAGYPQCLASLRSAAGTPARRLADNRRSCKTHGPPSGITNQHQRQPAKAAPGLAGFLRCSWPRARQLRPRAAGQQPGWILFCCFQRSAPRHASGSPTPRRVRKASLPATRQSAPGSRLPLARCWGAPAPQQRRRANQAKSRPAPRARPQFIDTVTAISQSQ
jgi:hypothetical protein